MTALATAPTAVRPIEIKFDADQEYQHDAMRAVIDLFKGQPLAATQFEIDGSHHAETLFTELGVGNALRVSPEQILANLDEIQDRHDIPESLRGRASDGGLCSMDFSIEMETGTGKTYVYLRTAIELHRIYGLAKFVIIVPSVAIREGVQANLRLLKQHFADLYDGIQYDSYVYDSTKPGRMRQFAQANHLQILIMNIDAFNKDANKIHQVQDQMMGRAPIEFLRASNPVVLVDEPQNMESETAKRALASLNPLAALRYSATHRNHYHCLYRLTPVDAYTLGLVKRIEVWSVEEDANGNRPHIKVVKVDANTRGVTAQLEVETQTPDGAKSKKQKVSPLSDLQQVTGRATYDGYVVEEINAQEQTVQFANGVTLRVGDTYGPDKDALQRLQVATAIAQHLDRELDIQRRVNSDQMSPMKVLSLFFIDKVANYWPTDGKIRRWFEEEYTKAAALPKYASLNLPPVEAVHDGYFATDTKGNAKNTSGVSKDDDRAYELIMRSKERLLSTHEPLRFIFSHSALREGWDNPNVFVITTLNETRSEVKKRQEIGRGLRLPVTEDGTRCTDPQVARLAIVANENYEDFASALQKEIEQDTGVTFRRENIGRGGPKTIAVRKGYQVDPDFVALWERIKHRTRYSVTFSTDDLITKAAAVLAEKPSIAGAYIRAKKSEVVMSDEGIRGSLVAEKAPVAAQNSYPIPDLLGHLTRHLPVSRATIAKILVQSGRLGDATTNPQQFLDYAQAAIDQTLANLLVEGITYDKIGEGDNAVYEMHLFEERPLRSYVDNLVALANNKSVYQEVPYDSAPEKDVALALDRRDDIKFFLKLPGWFKVDTPIGGYNPDWAIVKTDADGTDRMYLIRESKPHRDPARLRPDERLKVLFGKRHFEALSVGYDIITEASQV